MVKLPDTFSWLLDEQGKYIGCSLDYKEEWGAYRFIVADKMFAMIGQNKEGQSIITLKGLPERNEQYRTMYVYVQAGYYMNKQHWISISLDDKELDRDFVLARILDSYQCIVQKLPKKIRENLV